MVTKRKPFKINQSKVFFSQQYTVYIYTVFLPLATNKMALNKTVIYITYM